MKNHPESEESPGEIPETLFRGIHSIRKHFMIGKTSQLLLTVAIAYHSHIGGRAFVLKLIVDRYINEANKAI